MFSKNEFFKTQAKINSLKNDYGGNVIVKIVNEIQPAQEELIFTDSEVSKNRYVTTPEKNMKAEKVHFEPLGMHEPPKVFKDDETVQQNEPETPKKKKNKFCCCF